MISKSCGTVSYSCVLSLKEFRKCAMDYYMLILSHHFNYFVTMVELICQQVRSLIYIPFSYFLLRRRMRICIELSIIHSLGAGGALPLLILVFILFAIPSPRWILNFAKHTWIFKMFSLTDWKSSKIYKWISCDRELAWF